MYSFIDFHHLAVIVVIAVKLNAINGYENRMGLQKEELLQLNRCHSEESIRKQSSFKIEEEHDSLRLMLTFTKG